MYIVIIIQLVKHGIENNYWKFSWDYETHD